jgi:hypothetical protein
LCESEGHGQKNSQPEKGPMSAIVKTQAKALDQATMGEERLAGKLLSTKGIL